MLYFGPYVGKFFPEKTSGAQVQPRTRIISNLRSWCPSVVMTSTSHVSDCLRPISNCYSAHLTTPGPDCWTPPCIVFITALVATESSGICGTTRLKLAVRSLATSQASMRVENHLRPHQWRTRGSDRTLMVF